MPQAELDTVLQYFAILADKPDIPFSSDYPAFVKSCLLDDKCAKAVRSLVAIEGGGKRAQALSDTREPFAEFECLRERARRIGWQNWQDALLKFVYLCRLFGMEAK